MISSQDVYNVINDRIRIVFSFSFVTVLLKRGHGIIHKKGFDFYRYVYFCILSEMLISKLVFDLRNALTWFEVQTLNLGVRVNKECLLELTSDMT